MSWLKTLLVSLAAVLAPVKAVMLGAGFLIFADLISGLWRAWKEKESITSSGFRRTVTKIVAYELAIVTALVMETYLLDGVPIIKIVASMIAMTEGKSIMENLSIVTGVDFIKALLEKIQGVKEEDKKDE